MNPRKTTAALALATLFILAGCAANRRDADPFSSGFSPNSITIHVTNLNFMEATLYGVTTGTRQTLGRVGGKEEGVFSMELPFPTLIHIEIDLLAGPYCSTERLTVDPGDEFDLIIQQAGANTNCRVRR